MIQIVLQLLFTVHVKRLKYTPKNEIAFQYVLGIVQKVLLVLYSTVSGLPDYNFKEYKIYRSLKIKRSLET